MTPGATAEELEKRIAAELIEGSPALFLDNLNNLALRSDLLASTITERPARVRLLGKSQMVPLNASAFVILTGNGLKNPAVAAFDGQRVLVTNLFGDSVSLWKAADLTPLGSFPTGTGTSPFGACSDGVNFWITLQTAGRLARF